MQKSMFFGLCDACFAGVKFVIYTSWASMTNFTPAKHASRRSKTMLVLYKINGKTSSTLVKSSSACGIIELRGYMGFETQENRFFL